MSDQRLDDVTRELYRVDPTEFVSARDRRAAEAREREDEELASAIKKLRRPTTAAWAINMLASDAVKQLDSLISLGEQMRSAQRNLQGDEIRRLSRTRSQLLRELTDRAAALVGEAGHSLGDQARQQVEQTLGAALSDPEAARVVRAGTLTKPLEYSGFGLDELSAEAVRRSISNAQTTAAPKTGTRRKGRGGTDEAAARRRKLQEELTEAREELERAGDDLRQADQDVEDAESDRNEAQQRRSELREALERVERELRECERDVTKTRRRRERARHERESAEKRVQQLEKQLESDR